VKYTAPSFTVPASAGSADYCDAHGHAMPDARGRCIRCGAPLPDAESRTACDRRGHIWNNPDGTTYQRIRGKSSETVDVTCGLCGKPATLPKYAAYSGVRPSGVPVSSDVPPNFPRPVPK